MKMRAQIAEMRAKAHQVGVRRVVALVVSTVLSDGGADIRVCAHFYSQARRIDRKCRLADGLTNRETAGCLIHAGAG